MSYYDKLLKEYLNKFRNKYKGKLVQNNTRMYMNEKDDSIRIKLHDTDILTFYKDNTVRIYTGGWNTVTTRQRMNAWLPNGVYVWTDCNQLTCLGIEFCNEIYVDLNTKKVIKKLSKDSLNIYLHNFILALRDYASPLKNKTKSLKERIYNLKEIIRSFEKEGCIKSKDWEWIFFILRGIRESTQKNKQTYENKKLLKKEYNGKAVIYKGKRYNIEQDGKYVYLEKGQSRYYFASINNFHKHLGEIQKFELPIYNQLLDIDTTEEL